MADGTISKIQLPDNTIYDVVDNTSGYMTGMTILSYGSSTWQNFIDAYSSNKVVYCRASSNSNPASGSQTRLAFMAYVNNATTPTEVEFQYYRSVSSHTASQQGDQVYVYKLNKTNGWSVTVREASVKVVAGTGLGGKYSNGTMTLTGPTKVSDLTNDSGFITLNDIPTTHSIPSGGTIGQILAKNSATDYDVSWTDASGGGAYIVTFTYDNQNETWSCDKTAQEIYEANEAGYTVIAFAINSYYDGYVFYLDTATTLPLEGGATQVYTHFRTLARFSKYGSSVYYFELFEIEYADNNITFSEHMFDTHGFIQNYETENVTSGLYIGSESGAFAEHYNLSSGKSADIYWSSREGEQNDETLIKFTADHIKTDNFTPTENDDVSTKKYVDDAVSGISVPTKTSDLTNDSGFITGYTETDPVFNASAAASITSTDISAWNGKQESLVSGTNIKTINGGSILGSGNISIQSDNIFIAEIGTTSYADIDTAFKAGKLVIAKSNGTGDVYFPLVLDGSTDYGKYVFQVEYNKFVFQYTVDANGWTMEQYSIPSKTSDLTNDSGFINSIKTINNQSLIGSGNITVSTTAAQIIRWTEST